jgi:hypothetical protein
MLTLCEEFWDVWLSMDLGSRFVEEIIKWIRNRI